MNNMQRSCTAFTVNKPLTSLKELASVERLWREIEESSSNRSIFLSFDFVKLWYECFAEKDQIRVYPVVDKDRVIGFFPLYIYKKGPFRVLSSLTNDHCMHAGPVIAGGYESEFSMNCIDTLLSDRKGWDLLKYHCGYSFQKGLPVDVLYKSNVHFRMSSEPTYSILLPVTFEDYFNHGLKAKVRHNVRWWRKQLNKTPSYEFQHYTGKAAIEYWPLFLTIEDSGWKGRGGSSIKSLSSEYQSYYNGLIHLLSDKDLLHMYFLEIDGRAAAGGFGYIDSDTFHYWKIGYDENYYPSTSASNLLIFYIIENLIDDFKDVKRFHMFPWDNGYKHRYVNEKAMYSKAVIFNRTFRGACAYSLLVLKDRIKSVKGFESVMAPALKYLHEKATHE